MYKHRVGLAALGNTMGPVLTRKVKYAYDGERSLFSLLTELIFIHIITHNLRSCNVF